MQRRERRRRPRFNVSWPIRLISEAEELVQGETTNLSQSGAYFRIESPRSLETGMTVSVRISIPAPADAETPAQTISGDARVVRLEEDEGSCGIALHFTEELAPFGDEA